MNKRIFFKVLNRAILKLGDRQPLTGLERHVVNEFDRSNKNYIRSLSTERRAADD